MNDKATQVPQQQGEAASSLGDPISLATDAVTKEWFVNTRDRRTGEQRSYHVTVADYTSVNPESPRIVVGVNGQRWSVEVHYGFSAYPLCGPPCTYSWEIDGNLFQLALDAISLRTWRGGLLLFVNGHEAKSNLSKPLFWFRRFVLRAFIGVLWLAAGVGVHLAASKVTRGDENVHRVLLVILFLGLSLLTMVMVLPCAIGLSYLIVGCMGVFKFGLANVISHNSDRAHSQPQKQIRLKMPSKTSASRDYVILEEESPYSVMPVNV